MDTAHSFYRASQLAAAAVNREKEKEAQAHVTGQDLEGSAANSASQKSRVLRSRVNSAGMHILAAKCDVSVSLCAGPFAGVPLSAMEDADAMLAGWAAPIPDAAARTTCAAATSEGHHLLRVFVYICVSVCFFSVSIPYVCANVRDGFA